MIATTQNGREIYRDSKIYMPYAARFGSHNRMGRGPYEKSGMIRDTALPPLRTVHETFEIGFPFKDVSKGKTKSRELLSNAMDVEIRLLYLPFGEIDQDHFVWKIEKRMVTLK